MDNTICVPITADTSNFQKAIKNTEQGVDKVASATEKALSGMGNSWAGLSAKVALVGAAFSTIKGAIEQYLIAPLSGSVQAFADFGDSLGKTAQRVGMSVETLGGLKFAAEQCGGNFDILTDAVKTFQNTLGAAQMGDAGALGKLGKVGIDSFSFEGLSNEDQLMKLADHIAAIGDKSEQTRTAMELFGDAGFKLLPFFQEGSEGIKKLIAEGKDIGAVLGEEDVASASNLADAMNRMKTSMADVSRQIIADLAPSITGVFNGISKVLTLMSSFYNQHKIAINSIAAGVTVIVGWKGAMMGVATALPMVVKGFTALKVAMLSNPYLLAGAAIISGIAVAFEVWNKKIKETEERIKALSEAAEKHEKEVLAANAADQKLFDRLQELANIKDPLNNSEVKEAQMLVDELEGKYGKLGISIDAATGKIKGMAQAQAILNREMAQKEIDALEERKRSLAEKQRAIKEEQEKNRRRSEQYVRAYENTPMSQRGSLSAQVVNGALSYYQNDKDIKEIDKEIAGLTERQNALRGITNPKKEEPEADKSREQLTKENRANREAQNAAKAARDIEYGKLDENRKKDIQEARDAGKDPYIVRQEKVNKDMADKLANLEKMIAIARKNGDTEKVKELRGNQREIRDNAEEQKRKIREEQRTERQKKVEERAKKLDEEAKEKNQPLIEKAEDYAVTAGKKAVEEAKQKQAEAVLSGDDSAMMKADTELKKAELELAKTVAISTGKARVSAGQKVADAQSAYAKAKEDGEDNKTLNELYKKVLDAQSEKDRVDQEYYNAVGTVRSSQEAAIKDAVAVTTSSTGTFSAYGMDAAVADIPQRQLEVLQKLLDNTDEIKEEQKNDGAYSKQ